MFGIEDFCGKLNGNQMLQALLHPNIAAGERDRLPGFNPPSDGGTSLFTRRLLRYIGAAMRIPAAIARIIRPASL